MHPLFVVKRGYEKNRHPKGVTIILAPTRGFEPPTPRLGGECSILLSYVGMFHFELCYFIADCDLCQYEPRRETPC